MNENKTYKEYKNKMNVSPIMQKGDSTNAVVYSFDLDTSKFTYELKMNGQPLSLANASEVNIVLYFGGDAPEKYPKANLVGVIEDKLNGKVSFIMPKQYLGFNGRVVGEIDITFKNGQSLTAGYFSFIMKPSFINGSIEIEQQVYVEQFEDLKNLIGKQSEDINKILVVMQEEIDKSNAKIDEIKDLIVKNDVLKKTDAEEFKDEYIGLLSVSDNIGKYEINPDNLVKLNEQLTDSQILQRAIDFCEQYTRDFSIRLGRFFEITETLRVSMNRPFLFIRGAGGGLINNQDDFMFSGREDKWSGGLYFKNVKFKEGTSEHALIEGGSKGKIIQVITDGCSFHKTPTFIKSEEFLQTVRIVNTDIINITNYFIEARNVYDVKFDNFLHEASTGGLLRLTETSTSNYAAMSLAIENGVIEGISKQPAISTTHLMRANFNNLYFEGNEFLDMDLSNGTKPHVGLSINNCFFGDNVNPDKKAGVKLGDMYTEVLSYDFSSNTSTNTPIFDFSKTNRNVNVDVSNCMVLDGKSIYAEQTDKMTSLNKKLRIKKLAEKTGMNFRINLDEYFAFYVENEIYVSAIWTRKGSPLYKNKFVGHLVFKTGMKDGKTMIKVEFRPTMSYTNTNFNDDSIVQLEPVWQSTLNEYLPVTSPFQKVTDSILLKNISGTQEVLDKCNYFVVSDILGI